MAETIMLPCGVVLPEPSEFMPGIWWVPGDVGWICDPERSTSIPPSWTAWYNGEHELTGTREECIAWLDKHVLALRSALLPRDAVERVEAVISDYLYGTPNQHERDARDRNAFARAVLAALGVTNG